MAIRNEIYKNMAITNETIVFNEMGNNKWNSFIERKNGNNKLTVIFKEMAQITTILFQRDSINKWNYFLQRDGNDKWNSYIQANT